MATARFRARGPSSGAVLFVHRVNVAAVAPATPASAVPLAIMAGMASVAMAYEQDDEEEERSAEQQYRGR